MSEKKSEQASKNGEEDIIAKRYKNRETFAISDTLTLKKIPIRVLHLYLKSIPNMLPTMVLLMISSINLYFTELFADEEEPDNKNNIVGALSLASTCINCFAYATINCLSTGLLILGS